MTFVDSFDEITQARNLWQKIYYREKIWTIKCIISTNIKKLAKSIQQSMKVGHFKNMWEENSKKTAVSVEVNFDGNVFWINLERFLKEIRGNKLVWNFRKNSLSGSISDINFYSKWNSLKGSFPDDVRKKQSITIFFFFFKKEQWKCIV